MSSSCRGSAGLVQQFGDSAFRASSVNPVACEKSWPVGLRVFCRMKKRAYNPPIASAGRAAVHCSTARRRCASSVEHSASCRGDHLLKAHGPSSAPRMPATRAGQVGEDVQGSWPNIHDLHAGGDTYGRGVKRSPCPRPTARRCAGTRGNRASRPLPADPGNRRGQSTRGIPASPGPPTREAHMHPRRSHRPDREGVSLSRRAHQGEGG